MKQKNSFFVFLLLFNLIFPIPSSADILHLKNGETIEGSVVQETENGVLIKLDIGTITFSRGEIEEIEKKPFSEKHKISKKHQKKGGTVEYKGRIYTKERFERLARQKGLQKYNGRWVTEHEKLGIQIENAKTPNIREVVKYASQAVVSVKVDDTRLGSGVIINSTGLFITNYHVVKDAKKISVKLSNDKSEYPARVVTYKEFYDIALVSMGGSDRPYLKLADSDSIKVGDPVIALGNPFGLATTVTTGIISSMRKLKDFPAAQTANLTTWQKELSVIQTDAAINPGNSGGPLLNIRGRIVGINTFGVSKAIAEGLNFAVHADELRKVYASYFK